MPDLRSNRPTGGMWLLLALLLAAPAAATLYHAAHVTDTAPPFRLTSTGHEGGHQGRPVPFSLQDYRGKTLVLDLMAVSCTACRYVTEDVLRPLQSRFGARPDFAILSVDAWSDPAVSGDPRLGYSGGESVQSLIALQEETGVPWRHAPDTDRVWQKYGAVALPRVLVLDAAGHVLLDHQGAPSRAQVERAVELGLAGSATPVPMLRAGLAGLAFLAGAAAVLTPCTVGLLPAYLALLLRTRPSEGPGATAAATRGPEAAPGAAAGRPGVARILAGGAATAAGIVTVYAVLAVAFALAGGALRPLLGLAGPAVGVLMVLAGLAALLGRVPGPMVRAWARRGDAGPAGHAGGASGRGFYLFGLAFAAAGFGCTGPLFLPLLLAGFTQGVGQGVLLFLLYAMAVAMLVLAAAAAVAYGLDGRLRALLRHARAVQVGAGALMVGAGAYVAWYFLAAP
ncbi:MAG TPA: cytochrome c biogenesis protein CcdA [Candidatus Thermoplasmatota archaeon]|nr:cytochrome c biogenesis protein CcdA [Candidatus Thermoplasmatota archaeon]